MIKFIPDQIEAREYSHPTEYPVSIISGHHITSQPLNNSGMLLSLIRDGLSNTNPGLSKVMVVSICVPS